MDGSSATVDRLAVIERLHRYFACLDQHDADAMRDCVTEDLLAFHTLVGEVRGREAFLAIVRTPIPGLRSMQHYCSNEQVTLDGDRATCRAYLYAQHEVECEGGVRLLPGGGRYTLELVRVEGAWRIRRLRNDTTWMTPGLAEVFAAAG